MHACQVISLCRYRVVRKHSQKGMQRAVMKPSTLLTLNGTNPQLAAGCFCNSVVYSKPHGDFSPVRDACRLAPISLSVVARGHDLSAPGQPVPLPPCLPSHACSRLRGATNSRTLKPIVRRCVQGKWSRACYPLFLVNVYACSAANSVAS